MTTPPKKKVVYVRGPNNTYRRKSYTPLISSEESGEIARKEEIDNALNDLMVCGFQVSPNPASPTKRANTKTKRNSAASADLLPSSIPEVPLRLGFAESVASKTRILHNSWMSQVQSFQGLFQCSAAHFVPPYVLGVVTTLLVQKNWGIIAGYARFVSNLLFMGVFWAVLAALVFWYAGMLQILSMHDVKGVFSKILGLNSAPTPEPSLNYGYDMRGRRREENYDTDSVLLSGSEHDPKPKLRTESEPHLVRELSPTKLTNVRPFIPPRRDSAESRPTQPVLNKYHTSDGLATARKNRFRLRLPEREKPEDPRRHSSASLEITSKEKQKPLPPLKLTRRPPDLELPLVHEVKLKSRFDQQLEDLQFEAARLGRLDTLLSKQSMLGTRANRRTFLSNVDEA